MKKKNHFIKIKLEGKSTFTEYIIKTPKGDIKKLSRVDNDIHTSWTLEHFIKTEEDYEKYMSMPYDIKKPDCSHLKEIEKQLGDKGIILITIGDPICTAAEVFEFGNFTVWALTKTEKIKKMLDKIYEAQLFYLKNILKEIKGAGYMFRICGPEYATPPYLSPEYFHEFVCKYDKEFVRLIKENDCFARIHCHGKIANVLNHIMEMEPDAIDPVEAPPSGDILLKEVKEKTKGKLCLMGNIQLKDLEYATPEEMERIAIDCINSAKEGSGYVIMPTAAPINVPLSPVTERNYIIFIETALKYGVY